MKTFTKRVFEDRIFQVNVTGNMHDGDILKGFTNIGSSVFLAKDSTTINSVDNTFTVSRGIVRPESMDVVTDSLTENKKGIYFRCSGGQAGAIYDILLQYESMNKDEDLESVIRVKVLDEE